MTLELTCIENKVNVCKEYAHLWSEFFNLFADGLNERKITEEEENRFIKYLTALAYNHFKYAELMGNKFKDADDIIDVLSACVSLQHLKTLSEAQFSKLQVEWHTLFIEMNKCLGRLMNELTPQQLDELHSAGRLRLPSEIKAQKKAK